MKRLIIFAGLACAALGQQDRPLQSGRNYDMTALHISSDGRGHIDMSGNVVITTDALVVYVDAAEYDASAKRIQASGNVIVNSNRHGRPICVGAKPCCSENIGPTSNDKHKA